MSERLGVLGFGLRMAGEPSQVKAAYVASFSEGCVARSVAVLEMAGELAKRSAICGPDILLSFVRQSLGTCVHMTCNLGFARQNELGMHHV